MRRLLIAGLAIALSLLGTGSTFASEDLTRVGPGNAWIPDVKPDLVDALNRPVAGGSAFVELRYSQDALTSSSDPFKYGCAVDTLDFYFSFNSGPMKIITTPVNWSPAPDFNSGSFSRSNTFPVVSAGTYKVQIKGAIRCLTVDITNGSVFHTFPIDISKEAFTAISTVKPSPLSIQSLSCTPPFKISMVKEISYSCTIKLSDSNHVADLISVSPAPGTPFFAGEVISRNTAKKWTKTKQGWTVKVGFILLTVSPSANSKLRAIERIQIGVSSSDKILNSAEGFNFLAEDTYANFILVTKK